MGPAPSSDDAGPAASHPLPGNAVPPALERLAGPHPIALAHRGFAPDGAENSLSAFARAVALGYRHLETDARVTADGVALAFHDDVLDRVTDRRGVLSRLPWQEVRPARLADGGPVPLLEEVLGSWPEVFVNVDLKSDAAVAPALAAVRRTSAVDRVCLAAFNDDRLERVRAELGPRVCTALGPREVLRLRLASWRGTRPSGPIRGHCAQVPRRLVDRRFVAAAHARGLLVHVWTVDDAPAVRHVLDVGVDGIFTDRADLLRDMFCERGWWPGTLTRTPNDHRAPGAPTTG